VFSFLCLSVFVGLSAKGFRDGGDGWMRAL
jgi:hypothetical protein